MSHPQPPYGPQDPNQPNPEQQPYPGQGGQPPSFGTSQPAGDPWAPLPPVPPQPPAGDPWAAPQPSVGDPWGAAPQPPVSGVPQPPAAGSPGEPWAQQPVSGTPGQPWAAPHQPTSGTPMSGTPYPPPPVSGAPYPPVSGTPGYPPVSGGPGYPPGAAGYPPGGPGYPPGGGAGYQFGAPMKVAPPKNNKTVLIVVIVVAVLALLCCLGGVATLIAGANKAADDLEKALPTPRTTNAAPGRTSPPARDGENFNLKPGETLVISDDQGTLEITVTRFATETKGCRSYAPAPSKGMYLIAHVTATVTKGNASINPYYFEWVAADGTTANGLASALSGCGDSLGSGSGLSTGSKRAGTVVFNVADKNGTLEYQHRFETVGSWKP